MKLDDLGINLNSIFSQASNIANPFLNEFMWVIYVSVGLATAVIMIKWFPQFIVGIFDKIKNRKYNNNTQEKLLKK